MTSNTSPLSAQRKTNYRWVICSMLLVALVINYLDRQVLSLTWEEFIKPEFNWSKGNYGLITGVFSLVYAVAMLFAGRMIDYLGTKKGYAVAIGVWSAGACLHTLCGIMTCGIVTGDWIFSFTGSSEHIHSAVEANAALAMSVTTVSVWLFIVARVVLSIGEAGNFPSSIKAVAEYFPKKDRGFATGIFNSGAQVGALIAPFVILPIAAHFGWEMSFFLIGMLGYIWLGAWLFIYKAPRRNPKVNAAELAYIEQDNAADAKLQHETVAEEIKENTEAKVGLLKPFTYRQTWAVIFGRFFPDSVWWFLLFWIPTLIREIGGCDPSSMQGMTAIATVYLISMLSLAGSYLPTYFINRSKLNPYSGRMKGLFVFALFPLVGLGAIPLGYVNMWFAVVIIGIMAAAHQSWSANVYNVVSDMFPKSVVATVTGAAGLASGLGSFMSNYGAGRLFDYAEKSHMSFLGFHDQYAGYMIFFLFASFAYLLSWSIMKLLVPKYKLVKL